MTTELDAVQDRFPGIRVDASAFGVYMEQVTQSGGRASIDDCFFAFALQSGDGHACTQFESAWLTRVGGFVASFRLSTTALEDLRALVRERVLPLPLGRHGRIASYRGRGSLEGWLRVLTMNVLYNQLRDQREVSMSAPPEAFIVTDPAADLLRHRFQPLLREALVRDLRALDSKTRTLLKLHFVEGVRLDDLARVHGVNRSTVFRWIENARQQLLSSIRRTLASEMNVLGADLESALRALQVDLDVHLSEIFSSSK